MLKLTKKEQKLLWLDRHNRKRHKCSLTVGDYCRILHTTVVTLLGKTQPSLRAKIEQRIIEVVEKEYSLE